MPGRPGAELEDHVLAEEPVNALPLNFTPGMPNIFARTTPGRSASFAAMRS